MWLSSAPDSGGWWRRAELKSHGVTDVWLIDQAGDVGGTWYWNRYPGAMCDVESYVYLPMLEELGYVPERKYSFQPEILRHAQAIATRYSLYEQSLFQTAVTDVRWDEPAARWEIKTDRQDELWARFVVIANGPLCAPEGPGPTRDRFLSGKGLPHQSLGLRLYRRRQPLGHGTLLADRAVGADRHGRYRRAVPVPAGEVVSRRLRVPAHPVDGGGPRQPPDRPGVGGPARSWMAAGTGSQLRIDPQW